MVLFCSIEASRNYSSPSQSLGSFCLSIFREKYIYTHTFICKCVSIHTYICICEYTYPTNILLRYITRTYIHTHTYNHAMHTCPHTYTYLHIHICTHTLHTYTQALTNTRPPIIRLHKGCSLRSLFSPASYFSSHTFFSLASKICSDIRVCPLLRPSLD